MTLVFCLFRSSILERCILKISTASVAVGTEDLDGIKRSGIVIISVIIKCYFRDLLQ